MERFDLGISVVFPAYNEESNLEVCVVAAHRVLKSIVKEFEIIIVNDGSLDKTGELCFSLERQFPEVKFISKKKNEGYGCALRDGFKEAKFDFLFFSDSDRQFDISNLRDLLPWVGEYDIVIGYRKKRRDSIKRKFLSWGYNKISSVVFDLNVRDIDCAFKLFKKRIFENIKIESSRFFVNTEILAKSNRLKYKIKEVGVDHFPRFEGDSKVRFKDIFWALNEMRRIYKYLNKTR